MAGSCPKDKGLKEREKEKPTANLGWVAGGIRELQCSESQGECQLRSDRILLRGYRGQPRFLHHYSQLL